MSEELKAALARIACLEGEIAKRDARIIGLESQYQRDVWGLNNEGDPIGGEPAGGYANDNARLRAELSALKAQGPVAYISGCYRDVIDGKSDRTPLGAELSFVNMGWIGQIPLYAAPVSEAKAQGVVMPERLKPSRYELHDAAVDAWNSCLDEVARLNAAPVQQVVPDGSTKMQWPEIVALVNEVLGCEAHKYPCERGSIGHEMTGINFNSLARIIDRVRYAAAPVQRVSVPAWMTSSRAFADRLYMAGWRDYADAQHSGVAGMYDELLSSSPEADAPSVEMVQAACAAFRMDISPMLAMHDALCAALAAHNAKGVV